MKQPKSKATASRVKSVYGTMYYVKDMAKSVKFFSERLGLKPAVKNPGWTEFRFGDHGLFLKLTGSKEDHANGSLLLRVDGIRGLVAALKAAGSTIGEVHEVHPGALAAELKDPNGNVIGLYEEPAS